MGDRATRALCALLALCGVASAAARSGAARQETVWSAFRASRAVEGECSHPNVTCQVGLDGNGVRFCLLNDTKPSCLSPTDQGYMFFPIVEDWPPGNSHNEAAVDGFVGADDATSHRTTRAQTCQDACGKRQWCQGFALHSALETCHLLGATAAACTLKSFIKCGGAGAVPSPLQTGWATYIAKREDGGYGPWSDCTLPDGGGLGSQSRECDQPRPALGGAGCVGPSVRSCTGAGDEGGWSKWGPCSTTCGNGTQARVCLDASQDCSGPSERACPRLMACPYWGSWSECSVTCGVGVKIRECVNGGPKGTPPHCLGGGDHAKCIDKMCPIGGGWSDWSPCTDGVRKRTCTNPSPRFGGAECEGLDEETCGEWGDWGPCSKSCGDGGSQARECLVQGSPSQIPGACAGNATRVCGSQPACPEWGEWGECSVTCGQGTQLRVCIGGSHGACQGPNRRPCPGLKTCPTGTYGPWSACSATCGTGVQHRECMGGVACDGPAQRPCEGLPKCSGWSEWSPCSATCNTERAVAVKTRRCLGADKDHECTGPARLQCTRLPACAVDGRYSDWSPCSLTCGYGWQLRTCTDPAPAHGGQNCSSLGPDRRRCLGGECRADGGWSDWSDCSAQCGVGVQERSCSEPAPFLNGSDCVGGPSAALGDDALKLDGDRMHRLCYSRSCHTSVSSTTFALRSGDDGRVVGFDTAAAIPDGNFSFRSLRRRGSVAQRRSIRAQSVLIAASGNGSAPSLDQYDIPPSDDTPGGETPNNALQVAHPAAKATAKPPQLPADAIPIRIGGADNVTPVPNRTTLAIAQPGSVRLALGLAPPAWFNLVPGRVQGAFTLRLNSSCPDHTPKCPRWLGYDRQGFVLTTNKTAWVRAMEAATDGQRVHLRVGRSWLLVDEDGIYLSHYFMPRQMWRLENSNKPVAGGYSAWSKCADSRRTRTCTNPHPEFDGAACIGPDEEPCVCEGQSAARVNGNASGTDSDLADLSAVSDNGASELGTPDTALPETLPQSGCGGDKGRPGPPSASCPSPLAGQTPSGTSDAMRNQPCRDALGELPLDTVLGLSFEEMVHRLSRQLQQEDDNVTASAAEKRARELLDAGC